MNLDGKISGAVAEGQEAKLEAVLLKLLTKAIGIKDKETLMVALGTSRLCRVASAGAEGEVFTLDGKPILWLGPGIIVYGRAPGEFMYTRAYKELI